MSDASPFGVPDPDAEYAATLWKPSPPAAPAPAPDRPAPAPVLASRAVAVPTTAGAVRQTGHLGPVGVAVRTAGEILVTLGVLAGLLVVYTLYWTDLVNSRTQTGLHRTLATQWAAPATVAPPGLAPAGAPPAVAPAVTTAEIRATGGLDVESVPIGAGFAELHVPRLGRSYDPVVVEGTDESDLQQGPGHYLGTALPGAVGDFALAGHRTTYGKPFNRLAEIRAGDHVVVETRSAWVTYVVTGETVVESTDHDAYVIAKTPPAIGDQHGSTRLLTMTTCNPEYSAAQRLVLRGIWVSTDPKAPGFVPDALRPGHL